MTLAFRDKTMEHGFAQLSKPVLKSPLLSMQSKVVYAQLMSYAWESKKCFPGRERLANENGVHINTIDKYIKELKDFGLITIERRGLGMTNLYIIESIDEKVMERLKPYVYTESQSTPCQESQFATESHASISPKSHASMTQQSRESVLKVNTVISKNSNNINSKSDMCQSTSRQQKLIPNLPEKQSKPKKQSMKEKALDKVQQAKANKLPWEKLTFRDFTFYYIEKHNEKFSKEIMFDMYNSVTVMRECVIKRYNIPLEKACEYIDSLLEHYSNHKDAWEYLSFGMLQNQRSMIDKIMVLVEHSVNPKKSRFKVNDF